MYNALGFIEISGTTAAVTALDIMCKTAGVELVTWERKLGGRLVTLVITGEVSAVSDSIEAAKKGGLLAPVATLVIPNPHPETMKMVELSAARLKRKTHRITLRVWRRICAPASRYLKRSNNIL